MRFSVIIPVFNEAAILERTVPSVLRAIDGTDAEVVYACNGCKDASADIIRSLVMGRVQILELPQSGKTLAFNAGEACVSSFPRFYLDADVVVACDTFRRLAVVLNSGNADLISPCIEFDSSESTRLARAIAEIWLALPHGNGGSFHHLLGVSAQGRDRWGVFPTIIADDDFIVVSTPKERRCVASDLRVTTWAPRTFMAWARVRARWSQGQRQLARLGFPIIQTPGQRSALRSLLVTRGMAVQAFVYLLNRLVSVPLSRWSEFRRYEWFQDRPCGR